MKNMKINEVKKNYERKFFKKANVVGVMIGYKTKEKAKTNELSIVCMVEKKIDKAKLKKKDLVPPKIKGFTTDVIQVGKIRALDFNTTARHTPCPMGTSGGHYLISAGTNGELLRDKRENKLCIGTNNHVGANSNDAEIGDPYLQPGPDDGGINPDDIIGNLLRFVPIHFSWDLSTCIPAQIWSAFYNVPARLFGRRTRLRAVIEDPEYNLVDAAMIEIDENDVTANIADIGIPKGVKQAQVDMLVQKSGRTTGHTIDGEITGIDATILAGYPGLRYAYFTDQIAITKEGFSNRGDSGSLVLDMEGYAVGKLFAGNLVDITYANQIQTYLDLLEAELIIE